MTGETPTPPPDYPPELVRAAMDQSVSDILRNVPASQTVPQLCRMGLDPETAAAIYGQVRAATRATRQRSAIVLMLSGVFWLAGGGLAYFLSRLGYVEPMPSRVLGLLTAIAAILTLTGFFRWRRAMRL